MAEVRACLRAVRNPNYVCLNTLQHVRAGDRSPDTTLEPATQTELLHAESHENLHPNTISRATTYGNKNNVLSTYANTCTK